MVEAFSAADVRSAEEPLLARERGFDGGLMHRAALGLALAVRRDLRRRRGRVAGRVVVGLVGAGNNGGDALHALALLARHGVAATALAVTPQVHDGGLAALVASGGRVLTLTDGGPGERVWTGEALAHAMAADVVLDGLLGIGARGGLREPGQELVRLLEELLAEERAAGDLTRPWVVAVDVPSGIGVDDGTVPGPVLTADVTVTFGVPKPGLLLPPASALAGSVVAVDLGLGAELRAQDRRPVVTRLGDREAGAEWPVPGSTAHKYARGVLGVVAGSVDYPGAAVLAVSGALAAGCGMVRYVGPAPVTDRVLTAHPEVVGGTGRVQAWVLGPGLPAGSGDQADAVRAAFAEATEKRLPVVVDAGALALLPGRSDALTVLTPHAGELATLLTARGVAVERDQVEAEPYRWAREAHRLTGATVLLKGPTTVVVGDDDVYAQADSPAWLATAGAGDVLAGVLGALLAGRSAGVGADPRLVARLAAVAALAHGRAAQAANPGGPVTASGVAAAVPGVVAALVAGHPAGVGRSRRTGGSRLPMGRADRRVAR